MGYRLDGSNGHVKGKNFAITFRNNSGRLETCLDSGFGDANESGGQTFASVRVNRDAVASFGFDGQFVFHVDTLTVHDDVCNNFLRLFDRIFVEFVKVAPVGLVIHEFVDAPFGVAKGDLESHDVVDVNFSFNFHAYSMGRNFAVVNRLFFVFDENFVLTFLTHPADVILFHAERVAENVGAFSTGDAGSTSNRERASAAQIAEADVVKCGDH